MLPSEDVQPEGGVKFAEGTSTSSVEQSPGCGSSLLEQLMSRATRARIQKRVDDLLFKSIVSGVFSEELIFDGEESTNAA